MGSPRLTGLLDSVIVIEHLNGLSAAKAYLDEEATHLAISVITRAEVLAGTNEPDLPRTKALLDRFPLFDIDLAVADRAAELRRKHRWRLPDALQAATAELHGLKLVTRNTKDFPPAKHALVLVPY